jgi:alpha-ketoglutarate-dependent taurine dioxygenase
MRVWCGGEALRADVAQELVARSREVWNMYGPTETTVWSTTRRIRGQEERIVVGRGIANTQVYVLDAVGELVPWGRIGEVYLGGAGLAQGYLGNGEQTAARFVPDGYGKQAGGRLYRTGDLGRWTQTGDLEIVGRADQQIKLRGYRIELGEIETVLRGVAGVREAVVVLWEERLVAYLMRVEQEEGPTNQQVRAWVRERLPEYMQPSQLVWMDVLPVTANGKLDRRALPAPSVEHEVGLERENHETNPVEELLQHIWESVLHREGIGRRENFFELGGHSLLATQVMARVRSRLQVEVPLRSFFEAPTIAYLGQRVQDLLRHKQGLTLLPPLVAVSHDQPLPLSFAQQRLWFLEQLEPGNIAYNMPYAVSLQGTFHVNVLEQCLSELIRRHESLRTVFRLAGEEPVQCILPAFSVYLPLVDLSGLTGRQKEEQMRWLAEQEAVRSFDLAQGPLLRVWLLRMGVEEHTFLFTMHHIVSDAWSLRLIVRELGVLSRAFEVGAPSPLPELAIQYADYAFWQRGWLQGALLEQHLRYWREQLTGTPVLKLPTDYPYPSARSYRGLAHYFKLSPELAQSLLSLSQQEGVTLFILLLAAFQAFFHNWTGMDDFITGTDVANRTSLEVEPLIGFFVNQLALRSKVTKDLTFRQFLKQAAGIALAAYTHQDVPFEKVVEVLRPDRSLHAAPLFQVKFLLQTETKHDADAASRALALPGIAASSLSLFNDMAKVDFMLSMSQTTNGLAGAFVYSSDLFRPDTIEDLVGRFVALLEGICRDPDTALNSIELLTEEEREQRIMQQKEFDDDLFNEFETLQPKVVSLQQEKLVRIDYLAAGQSLPRVIAPDKVGLDLADWARNNQDLMEAELLEHGAILFRGFHIQTPVDFERFAQVMCADLFSENGEHVPVQGMGNGNLYTPVFYAPEKKLLWHNENSFNHNWPMKIMFYCAQPAQVGGETPIVDSRKVFQRIHPHIREQFMQKGIIYVRNYSEELGLSWQKVFSTTDKAEVEAQCRAANIEFEWKKNDGLKTRQLRPAVVKHVHTGEWVWWNQATHWHLSCLDEAVRDSLCALFAEEDLPRTCYYGDGSPIEDADMVEINAAYQAEEISFPWQKGDIMLLDNMLVAHARNAYQGPRKIYVSMGNMITLDNLAH